MAITIERAEQITGFLTADTDRARQLVAMEPAEAVKAINAQGYDFTEEEIKEYGEALKLAATQGELSEENLDEVAGGVGPLAVAGAIGIAFGVGVLVGGLEKAKVW